MGNFKYNNKFLPEDIKTIWKRRKSALPLNKAKDNSLIQRVITQSLEYHREINKLSRKLPPLKIPSKSQSLMAKMMKVIWIESSWQVYWVLYSSKRNITRMAGMSLTGMKI